MFSLVLELYTFPTSIQDVFYDVPNNPNDKSVDKNSVKLVLIRGWGGYHTFNDFLKPFDVVKSDMSTGI